MFMGIGPSIKSNDANSSERPNATIKFTFWDSLRTLKEDCGPLLSLSTVDPRAAMKEDVDFWVLDPALTNILQKVFN